MTGLTICFRASRLLLAAIEGEDAGNPSYDPRRMRPLFSTYPGNIRQQQTTLAYKLLIRERKVRLDRRRVRDMCEKHCHLLDRTSALFFRPVHVLL